MKYTDKTDEEWDDIVEKWHTDDSITCSLPEFMNLDEEQYLRFVHAIRDDSFSYEEVKNISCNIAKEVVTELVIKPQLQKVTQFIKK